MKKRLGHNRRACLTAENDCQCYANCAVKVLQENVRLIHLLNTGSRNGCLSAASRSRGEFKIPTKVLGRDKLPRGRQMIRTKESNVTAFILITSLPHSDKGKKSVPWNSAKKNQRPWIEDKKKTTVCQQTDFSDFAEDVRGAVLDVQ